VQFAWLLPADANAALEQGDIDVWASWGVFAAQAVLANHDRIIVDGSHGLLSGLGYLSALDDAIAAKRELVHDLVGRAARAARWASAHVDAAAHTHSTYGKAWSTLGRLLDPLTQDACAFYEDHAVFDPFTGVVLQESEGVRLAAALGRRKALILQNHGLLTVGTTIEAAAWWFISMDNTAHAQLLAEAAGKPVPIAPETARHTATQVGTERGGALSFQPLYDWIVAAEPDLLD
jgi:Class II Aldolase and Adducin N-terminal domain